MLKSHVIGLVAALAVALPLTLADTASAAKAKKISYEEAWAECKKDVSILPGEQQGARYTRGAGCMKKHGYRLKKSDVQ